MPPTLRARERDARWFGSDCGYSIDCRYDDVGQARKRRNIRRRHWSNWTPFADTIKQRGVLLPLHRIPDGSEKKTIAAAALSSAFADANPSSICIYRAPETREKVDSSPIDVTDETISFCQQVKRRIAENISTPHADILLHEGRAWWSLKRSVRCWRWAFLQKNCCF